MGLTLRTVIFVCSTDPSYAISWTNGSLRVARASLHTNWTTSSCWRSDELSVPTNRVEMVWPGTLLSLKIHTKLTINYPAWGFRKSLHYEFPDFVVFFHLYSARTVVLGVSDGIFDQAIELGLSFFIKFRNFGAFAIGDSKQEDQRNSNPQDGHFS